MAEVVRAQDEPVLIIASSDMNHYENDATTRIKDQKALEHILRLDARGLYDTARNEDISMCGLGPTVAMITAARLLGAPARRTDSLRHLRRRFRRPRDSRGLRRRCRSLRPEICTPSSTQKRRPEGRPDLALPVSSGAMTKSATRMTKRSETTMTCGTLTWTCGRRMSATRSKAAVSSEAAMRTHPSSHRRTERTKTARWRHR